VILSANQMCKLSCPWSVDWSICYG